MNKINNLKNKKREERERHSLSLSLGKIFIMRICNPLISFLFFPSLSSFLFSSLHVFYALSSSLLSPRACVRGRKFSTPLLLFLTPFTFAP